MSRSLCIHRFGRWRIRAPLLVLTVMAAGCALVSPRASSPRTRPAATLERELTLEEFQARVASGRGWIVDARPRVFYELGHVPGAIGLPRDHFESAYAASRAWLEKDRRRSIAVYCSDLTCDDSGTVRLALVKLGYDDVAVFHGGWAAWTAAGLPEEKEHR